MRKRAVLFTVWIAVVAIGLFVIWPSLSAPLPEAPFAPQVPVSAHGTVTSQAALPTTTGNDPAAARRAASPIGLGVVPPLQGTVSAPNGTPCAGATVTAESSGVDEYCFLDAERRRARAVVATATCDGDGHYALALPAGRHHLLRVRAAGFAPAFRDGCQAGSTVDFRLGFGATLAGVVRDEQGLTVPGTSMIVTISSGLVRVGIGEAVTDARGTYRIDGLPPGAAQVDVQPTRLAAPRDADVVLHPSAVTVLDVVLLAGITIRGRVLDADTRQGIVDAEVGEGLVGRTVRTDAAGGFTLVGFAPLHNLSLRVAATGYAPSEKIVRGAGTTLDDVAREVEFVLQRGYAIGGVVVDAGGAPLAGVYVAAAAADYGGDHNWFRSDWRSQTTGSDGRFLLPSLRPDMQHELVFARAGLATAIYACPARSAAATVVDVGEVRLQPAASVAGVVVDEREAPIGGYEVELVGHNRDRWRLLTAPPAPEPRVLDGYAATRRARTDEAGRFHFADVAAGDYVVRAAKFDSHKHTEVRTSVAASAEVADVRLVMFRGFPLTGRVVRNDGAAVPKCYCSIDPEDGQATSGDVECAADGTFRAAGLLPGNYKVTVYPYASDVDRAVGRSFASREFAHVPAGTQALQCELIVLGTIQGSVRNADESAASGRFVVVHDGQRQLECSAIGENAQFSFALPVGIPLRVYVVAARADGNGPAAITTALVSAEVSAGAPPLVLVLPP